MARRRMNRASRTTNKRERILRAAEKEFALRGFEGARVDRIATAAGLDKASLYYYFRSKQEIYNSVLEEAMRKFAEISSAGFERDIDPGEELAAFVDVLLDFLNKHKSFALVLRREFIIPGRSPRGAVYTSLTPLIRRVRRYVQREIEKGEMRRVDPEHALYSIFEILFGYFTLNPEAAKIFFDMPPYTKEMIERRKAHVTDLIRKLLHRLGK